VGTSPEECTIDQEEHQRTMKLSVRKPCTNFYSNHQNLVVNCAPTAMGKWMIKIEEYFANHPREP
jgi:L-lactate utilization protein LutC